MGGLALMCKDHFGLDVQPFSLTPNTRFYLNASSHSRALETLLIALDGEDGFIKVIGEVGTGKTMLCRKLINSLDDGYVTALVVNPQLAPGDFYRAVAEELRIKLTSEMGTHQVLRRINAQLVRCARHGKKVLLAIDEAQVMPPKTIEALRLLTNLETESRKLLQVVLFGQPELDDLINRKSLRQMKQRITFQEELDPLDFHGVESYIQHRVRVAGYQGDTLFEHGAIRLIHRRSKGIPRLINVLSHKSMLAAFGRGDHVISRKHVRRAAADTESVSKTPWFWSVA